MAPNPSKRITGSSSLTVQNIHPITPSINALTAELDPGLQSFERWLDRHWAP